MTCRKASILIYPLIVMALLMHSVGGWAAMQSSAQIIDSNALLKAIYLENPEKALSLVSEARQLLASVERGQALAGEPKLKFRGGIEQSPVRSPPEDGEILSRNRKDYDQNPILREIYQHSPLASLRMLKRLREATEKSK